MKARNLYAGGAVDRAAHRRNDADWIEAQLHHAETRILPVWRNQNLILATDPPAAGRVSLKTLGAARPAETAAAFLGLFEAVPHFAVDVSHLDDPADLASAAGAQFADLRELGPLLDPAEAGLLAYARGLLYWHRHHAHCGACGARTASAEAGHMRRCQNQACGAEHFPRTDPAVITLVTAGDACLLGRQASWPEGMYSTLAGFVEPGESLEDAVAREVFEETGVRVTRIRYIASQPWPFPASLMLGFRAEAEPGAAIAPTLDELEAVRWFTRTDLANRKAIGMRLPYRGAIARAMIEGWLETG
ncbi:MAG: NAD(+) diphosphatase [Alphaproteobacteria bacterium]|nr:NAD(+) diphosphatase [Alphaproteobacteria bacterium]